jgi:hypothetical protein
MPRRKDDQPIITPEVHSDYLINHLDEVVFGQRQQSLDELSGIAFGGNQHAKELVDLIDKLDLWGKLSDKPEHTNDFGRCPGHGPFTEIDHQKGEQKIKFRCDRCGVVKEEDKPPILKDIEDRGYTWNQIHFSPQKRAEIEKERNRKLVEQWAGNWEQMMGGQSDSTIIE